MAERDYKRWLKFEDEVWQLVGRRWLSVLYRTLGRFEKAKEQAQHGLELSEKFGRILTKSRFHSQLGHNYFISGNLEKALDEFSEEWDIAVKNDFTSHRHFALYMKGRIFLEMNSMDEAQKAAEELKKITEASKRPKNIRLYHHLMGMIELEKKNFSKAINYFKNAYSEIPAQCYLYRNRDHAMFIYPLGLAYFMSGDLEKARGEYEKIMGMTTGRIWFGDLYAKSFYMLGKIYEQQGNKAKAAENYAKFLELWKDADSGIAEVEDAKKKLAELNNQ